MQKFQKYWRQIWTVQRGSFKCAVQSLLWWEWTLIACLLGVSLFLWNTKLDITIHLWFMETFDARWIHTWVWGNFSRFGQGWVQVLLCLLFAGWYAKNHNVAYSRVWALSIVAVLGVGAVFGWLLKAGLGRPRPKAYIGESLYDLTWFAWPAKLHSFPSGHTLTTFCLLAILSQVYPRLAPLLFGLAVAVGVSRVGIGSHWLSDILAGAALGYLCGTVFAAYFKLAPSSTQKP